MCKQHSSIWDYAAYIPCYDGGNSVMAVKKSGQTVTLDKGIKTVVRMLLKESSMDINAFRKNFSGSAGKLNLIPIPLNLDTVLIPLKVRKAIGKNDGAYAYVDMSSIKDVSGFRTSTVTLLCGMEIGCLESPRAVKRRMQTANMVKIQYALGLKGDAGNDDMSRIIADYGKIANIVDIINLILDIFRLGKRNG